MVDGVIAAAAHADYLDFVGRIGVTGIGRSRKFVILLYIFWSHYILMFKLLEKLLSLWISVGLLLVVEISVVIVDGSGFEDVGNAVFDAFEERLFVFGR